MITKTDEGYYLGDWRLWRLEPQTNGELRWSLGKFGPRAYITADEDFAVQILHAVGNDRQINFHVAQTVPQRADGDASKTGTREPVKSPHNQKEKVK